MGKAKRKPDPETWTEKHGCDGRPPITKAVAGFLDPDGKRNTVARRNTNHCTLCRLHHLGYLKDMPSDNSHEARALADMRHWAGEKLQDDHALSGQLLIKSALGALGGASVAAGPTEIAQERIDASRRKERALMAVGVTGRFLLDKIVLEDWTLEKAADIMRVNKKAVLPALRCALDALASHFGMDQTAKAKVRGGVAQPLHPFNSHSEDR